MAKHSKRSASIFRYPVLLAFSLFFVGLFALDLVTPDRAYSELENTTLSQRPSLSSFSADGLNKFFTAYTKYVKDQVAGRDNWVALQSTVETKVMQKEQSGGILLGKEHMMFPRTYGLVSSETRTLPKNTAALEALCRRYPGLVNVMLVPAASAVYPENVPAGAPLLDEDRYLDALSEAVQAAGGRFVDVRQTLADHKGEYIYYRTDHHWTSTGAYYAYQQLCTALGLTPFDPSAHTARTAEGFYGTHYSKARTPDAEPDTITWYDLPNQLTVYTANADGSESGETGPLYNTADFETRDKYKAFLRGNNGYSVLEGNGTGSILIIKDSYANAFIPYLVEDYASIGIVDFRYLNKKVDSLIERGGYDEILVLFSFQGFMDDMTLAAKIATP